jgi:two-component system, chemotaxis family, protein-glutamate methylesterase/glutaminase
VSGSIREQHQSGRDVIVIGGSAGVAEALLTLIKQLPASFPAAIFVAYHVPPGVDGAMQRMLAGRAKLEVKLADDGEPIRKGTVYVARPDRHLMLEKDAVRVTRGPRENRWRPAIDPLFRSAAVAHGSRVIGVVLTGMLDDGTAGLLAIKRCGGVAVVQDPHDAAYPGMPQSAIDNVPVDHRIELRNMGVLLERLVREPAGVSPPVPRDLREEARVSAEGVPVSANPPPGPPQYMCPECSGPLHSEGAPGEPLERYRCLVGHGWGANALLSSTNDQLESTVWASIRLFRQRAQLLHTQAERERKAGRDKSAHHYRELMQESLDHAQRLQELVMGSLERAEAEETPELVGGAAEEDHTRLI